MGCYFKREYRSIVPKENKSQVKLNGHDSRSILHHRVSPTVAYLDTLLPLDADVSVLVLQCYVPLVERQPRQQYTALTPSSM